MRIKVKALTVNSCWKGKRYKTDEYKNYERLLLFELLPYIPVPVNCELRVKIIVGFSNRGSDLDNIVKPFLDILQKKYKFNDNRIYKLTIIKEIVKKGNEFIDFNITKYETNSNKTTKQHIQSS
ncbi:MAG: RusA family crossover junction endodeoxyribonuclease [Cyclobacteriaceae bacterium]